MLMFAWPLHAQRGMEGKDTESSSPPRKSATKSDPKKSSMPDRVRPPSQQNVTRPQDQRAREPQRTEAPTIKQDRTRRSDIYPQQKSAPSPAQQLQQQELERRQPQNIAAEHGARCSAHPVCRKPGGYGRCQGVVRTYASSSGARQDMVERCIEANTPDECNCAAQCARVAQCSKF